MNTQKIKYRFVTVRVNENQFESLEARCNSSGFKKKSEYIRAMLFGSLTDSEKIGEMYEMMMRKK